MPFPRPRPPSDDDEIDEYDRVYHPRKVTKREKQDQEQQARDKRVRRTKRAVKQQTAVVYNGITLSNISGIGYRDYNLGPSRRFRSRSELDYIAYTALPPVTRGAGRSVQAPGSIPSLSSICVAVAAENYGGAKTWTSLNQFHAQHARTLLDATLKRSGERDRLPFETWATFGIAMGSDEMPRRWSTYRGLCLDDANEIGGLKDLNAASRVHALKSPLSMPGYFLAVLDLSNAKSLQDGDVSKLKSVAPMLASLYLNGTGISDIGLRWIGNSADGSDCYQHLQVLSLKGCRQLTNEGVMKLVKLPLRMLDLRGTSATADIKRLLNMTAMQLQQGTRVPWQPARIRPHLERPHLELELFGGSFSLTRTVAYLHRLAVTPPRSSDADIVLQRPLCIHVTSLTRTSAEMDQTGASASGMAATGNNDKTPEELFRAQMEIANRNSKSAYNPTFGNITSTSKLSRASFEEMAIAAADTGSAFRMRDDGVANGVHVGLDTKAKLKGRSMFDISSRKLTPVSHSAGFVTREELSDTEEEVEAEQHRQACVAEAQQEWDKEEAQLIEQAAGMPRRPGFYRRSRPADVPPRKRLIVAAEPSEFMLVRHLPYVPPWVPVTSADMAPTSAEKRPIVKTENAPLVKRAQNPQRLLPPALPPRQVPPPASASSSGYRASSESPHSHASSFSTPTWPTPTRPSSSPDSTNTSEAMRSKHVNPFAVRQKQNVPSTSQASQIDSTDTKLPSLKLIRMGPALKSRNKLSAFQRR